MAKPRRHFFGFQGEAKAAADLSFVASLFSLVFIPSVLILCFIFLSSSYMCDSCLKLTFYFYWALRSLKTFWWLLATTLGYKHSTSTSSQPAAIFSTSSKEDLTSGDIFACQEGKVLLESSRKRPRVLLSILQCPGQLPTTRSY